MCLHKIVLVFLENATLDIEQISQNENLWQAMLGGMLGGSEKAPVDILSKTILSAASE